MKNSLLFFFIFFASACLRSAEPVLPEASQIGKNTFGCLMDGQVWLPNNYNSIFFVSTAHEAYYISTTHRVLITAQQYSKENGRTGFSFLFDVSIPNQIRPVFFGKDPQCTYYDKNETYIPMVNTSAWYVSRFDTINQIVSGSFSMELLGQRTRRPVSVIKGVFDLKLKVVK